MINSYLSNIFSALLQGIRV